MDLSGSVRFEDDGRARVSEMDMLRVFDDRLIYSWFAVLLRE